MIPVGLDLKDYNRISIGLLDTGIFIYISFNGNEKVRTSFSKHILKKLTKLFCKICHVNISCISQVYPP